MLAHILFHLVITVTNSVLLSVSAIRNICHLCHYLGSFTSSSPCFIHVGMISAISYKFQITWLKLKKQCKTRGTPPFHITSLGMSSFDPEFMFDMYQGVGRDLPGAVGEDTRCSLHTMIRQIIHHNYIFITERRHVSLFLIIFSGSFG